MGTIPDRKRILADGGAKIRVQRRGVYQQLTFTIVREQTPFGPVPYLCTIKDMDLPELARIANAAKLPVRSKTLTIFPDKTSAHDFANL